MEKDPTPGEEQQKQNKEQQKEKEQNQKQQEKQGSDRSSELQIKNIIDIQNSNLPSTPEYDDSEAYRYKLDGHIKSAFVSSTTAPSTSNNKRFKLHRRSVGGQSNDTIYSTKNPKGSNNSVADYHYLSKAKRVGFLKEVSKKSEYSDILEEDNQSNEEIETTPKRSYRSTLKPLVPNKSKTLIAIKAAKILTAPKVGESFLNRRISLLSIREKILNQKRQKIERKTEEIKKEEEKIEIEVKAEEKRKENSQEQLEKKEDVHKELLETFKAKNKDPKKKKDKVNEKLNEREKLKVKEKEGVKEKEKEKAKEKEKEKVKQEEKLTLKSKLKTKSKENLELKLLDSNTTLNAFSVNSVSNTIPQKAVENSIHYPPNTPVTPLASTAKSVAETSSKGKVIDKNSKEISEISKYTSKHSKINTLERQLQSEIPKSTSSKLSKINHIELNKKRVSEASKNYKDKRAKLSKQEDLVSINKKKASPKNRKFPIIKKKSSNLIQISLSFDPESDKDLREKKSNKEKSSKSIFEKKSYFPGFRGHYVVANMEKEKDPPLEENKKDDDKEDDKKDNPSSIENSTSTASTSRKRV